MLDTKYNPHAIESKTYHKWEASGAFEPTYNDKQPTFCIMMPPPNVTGSLHIGHALNYTLQDVLVRYYRMLGYDVLWQPGTDHAGIATQMVVERNLAAENLDRRQMGREAFLKRVWDWKEHSGNTIVQQQRQLGISPAWSRQRFTMDEGLSKAVRHIFVKLYKDGLIYRAKRLVNWDPKLLTAVSDLEVKNTDSKGHLWYIRYPLVSDATLFITIATTRPETLFGDTAVAVHPEDPRYQGLIGQKVRVPFVNREIPIIADTMSDPEKGTGAVKITPAHDFKDFEVGQRHSLDMINIFDEHACLNDQAPKPFQGLDRFKARDLVIQELERLELLEKTEAIQNALPYGERSNVILEPRLTDQWFMHVSALAEKALVCVEDGEVALFPESWKATYRHWMSHIQPWCISRQLWWGHQLPVWYGPDQKPFVAETAEEALAEAKTFYGKAVDLTQDDDVLDTWFSSALWPFSTLGWPEQTKDLDRFYPTSVLITGTDILFFWVARMMMMGLYATGKPPFHKIVLHALVRDQSGQKMSKSKGNVVDPLDLMQQFGGDAMRFAVAALSSPGRDIRFSQATVELYRNFGTKLWNAVRFLEMNQVTYDEAFDPTTCQHPMNQWIVQKIAETNTLFQDQLTRFRFDEAALALYQFVWGTFCDWYIEFSKILMAEAAPEIQTETKKLLGWLMGTICHLLHPMMPFITEEIWSHLAPQGGLLIKAAWPKMTSTTAPTAAVVDTLIDAISEIRGIRNQMNVPAAARVDLWIQGASPDFQDQIQTFEAVLKRLARLESLKFLDTLTDAQGIARFILKDVTFCLPLKDFIDVAAEQVRLQKLVSKLAKDVDATQKKLSNPAFMDNAPEDIVEELKERYDNENRQLQKLQEALRAIAG